MSHNPESSPVVVAFVNEELQPGPAAYLPVVINKIETVGLWDTGSAYSLISAKLWNKLKLNKELLDPKVKLCSASGDEINVLGYSVLELELPAQSIRYPVIVSEGLPFDLILGSNLMDMLGIQMDYRQRLWWYKDSVGLKFRFITNCVRSEKVGSISTKPWRESLDRANLTKKQYDDLDKVFSKYSHVFSEKLGCCNVVEMYIETVDERPVYTKPYRFSAQKAEALKPIVDEMLEQGLIEPSDSDYSSPAFLRKKSDGSWRFIVDYRRLNKKVRKDNYQLPRCDDIIDAIGTPKFITSLDLKSA